MQKSSTKDAMKPLRIGALAAGVLLGGMLAAGAPAANAAPITLTVTGDTFAPNAAPTDKWWKIAAAVFEKAHPGVKVKIRNVVTNSESTYYAKLDLLERSAATTPDVIWEDSFLVKSDAEAGYLAALPELQSFEEYKSLYPTFKHMTAVHGTPYAMMVETDVEQMYYDTNIFKRAGLPAAWKPKGLADIIAAAEAIKAKVPGVIPLWIYIGTPQGEASSFRGFQVLLDGTPDRLYDARTKKWETGGPGFDAVFNFLAALHDKHLAEGASYWSNPNSRTVVDSQLMPEQKVGIVLDGSWVSTGWLPAGARPWPAAFASYKAADVPTANGAPPGVTNLSGGWAMAIPAKSPHRKLALAFIETATSLSLLARYDSESGQIPVEANVASDPVFVKGIANDPLLQQAVTYARTTHYRPAFGPYNQITTDIQTITGSLALGKMTAAQAEKAYARDVTRAAGSGNVESHGK